MNRFRLARYFLLLTALLAALLRDVGSVHSSARYGWETPQIIPGLVDTGRDPYFVVDPAGKLHVFHSQWVGEQVAIVYSQWTVGGGWLAPVDIIVSDDGQARIAGAFVDDNGMMNLIFWGGIDLDAGIFYTRAPLTEVMRSTSWPEPRLIGPDAIAPTTAAIVSDQQGYLVVVYAGNREGGNGLYSVISTDYGVTWTAPSPVLLTASNSLWPSPLDLMVAHDGSVHAVWALADTTGNGLRIQYASCATGENQWSSPIILAEAINYEADTPSIIEYGGNLMVIFHNDFPTTRHMTISVDNGETWSTPVRLFEQVGSNGPAALVVDGANTLHMFFGNRIDASLTHGVWHSVWESGGWSAPIAVVSGPQVLVGDFNEEGFDPSEVQALICHGSILFLAWRHDPMAGPTNIWYTYQYLDTPALPTMAVRIPTTVAAATPESEQIPSITEGMDEDINRNVEDIGSLSTAELLVYSLVPGLLLITILLLWRQNRH
jgi:hypothetical protein